MRKKIVTVAAAGVLGLSGLALAGPALAAAGAPSVGAAVSSKVDRVKQALAGLVTDGTLNQGQADRVASTLGAAGVGPDGHGRRGGHGGPDLAAAATALGTSEADLRTALQGGRTLAQVAKDKGVAVDTLVSALVDAEKTRTAKQVTDGRLTQAQADQRLEGLTARVTQRVNSARPAHAPDDDPARPASPASPAAPTG